MPAQILDNDGYTFAIAQTGAMEATDLIVQRLQRHQLIVKRDYFASLDSEICIHFVRCKMGLQANARGSAVKLRGLSHVVVELHLDAAAFIREV